MSATTKVTMKNGKKERRKKQEPNMGSVIDGQKLQGRKMEATLWKCNRAKNNDIFDHSGR